MVESPGIREQVPDAQVPPLPTYLQLWRLWARYTGLRSIRRLWTEYPITQSPAIAMLLGAIIVECASLLGWGDWFPVFWVSWATATLLTILSNQELKERLLKEGLPREGYGGIELWHLKLARLFRRDVMRERLVDSATDPDRVASRVSEYLGLGTFRRYAIEFAIVGYLIPLWGAFLCDDRKPWVDALFLNSLPVLGSACMILFPLDVLRRDSIRRFRDRLQWCVEKAREEAVQPQAGVPEGGG